MAIGKNWASTKVLVVSVRSHERLVYDHLTVCVCGHDQWPVTLTIHWSTWIGKFSGNIFAQSEFNKSHMRCIIMRNWSFDIQSSINFRYNLCWKNWSKFIDDDRWGASLTASYIADVFVAAQHRCCCSTPTHSSLNFNLALWFCYKICDLNCAVVVWQNWCGIYSITLNILCMSTNAERRKDAKEPWSIGRCIAAYVPLSYDSEFRTN